MDIRQKITSFFKQYPTRRYDKNEMVIFADDTIPDVFYIEKGTVAQRTISDNGTTITLNIFKPGAFFPMSAALNQQPNSYFFEAQEACEVHKTPAQDAVTFLESNPDVMLDLLKRVYRGTDGLLARLTELMAGNAEDRIMTELRIAALRFGSLQPSGNIIIKITEHQLAEQTGLARETVSKAISRLNAAKRISTVRGKITLLAEK